MSDAAGCCSATGTTICSGGDGRPRGGQRFLDLQRQRRWLAAWLRHHWAPIAGISDARCSTRGSSQLYAVSTSGSALLVLERILDGSTESAAVLHDGDSGLDVVSGLVVFVDLR
ncbi:MAG: hypothetical protein H7A20_01770 [Rhodanobacteraceae bacterium]|nr:hypothetical protein [Rhodanobacteraceae bacterium]